MADDSYELYYIEVHGRLLRLRHVLCGESVRSWMVSFPPNIAELAEHAQRHRCPST